MSAEPFQPWSDGESDALDERIKANRKPERPKAVLSKDDQRKIITYPVRDDVIARHLGRVNKHVDAARKRKGTSPPPSLHRQGPEPRPTKAGRWKVVLGPPTVERRTQRSFDTREEALQWRDEVVKSQEQ